MDFQPQQQVWYHTVIGGWQTPCKYPARVIKFNETTGKYQIDVAKSPTMFRRMSVYADKITPRDESFVTGKRDSF